MKTLQETINEAISSKDLTSVFTELFESCNNQEDYKNALNAVAFALYKAKDVNFKLKKKQGDDASKFANQLSMAINSIKFEIDEVIKNDKIWRE